MVPTDEPAAARRPTRVSPRRAGGFTLVELLVVIGVIAVLLGIALPALGKARRVANRARCAAQLQQLGVAMYAYAHDHNNVFPYASYGWHPVGMTQVIDGDDWSWDDLISRYIGRELTEQEQKYAVSYVDHTLLRCPSDATPAIWEHALPGIHRRSYAMPVFTLGWMNSYESAAAPWPWKPRWSVKVGTLKRTAEKLMLVEGDSQWSVQGCQTMAGLSAPLSMYNAWNGAWPVLSDRQIAATSHEGLWNYLFIDGHVEALRLKETLAREPDGSVNTQKCSGMWVVDWRPPQG